MKNRHLIILLLTVCLSGCVTVKKKSLAQDIIIEDITIDRSVAVADEMYYYGPSYNAAMLFGVIGGAIKANEDGKESQMIEDLAKENNIDIKQIVYDAFSKAIEENTSYNLSPDSIYSLHLDIKQYGLSIPNGLASGMRPLLLVQAELKNNSQGVVWQGGHHLALIGNKIEKIGLEQLMRNPNVLKSSWEKAAKKVAEETVSQF